VAQPKLSEYKRKRDFGITPEPAGKAVESGKRLIFVVQKHHARRLHYDFRLELDGVLLSWAVPKGPSLDPSDKRLAVPTEDHPIEYGSFEGRIPDRQYGAGEVIIWDRGTWEPVGDPHEGHRKGKLKFRLNGTKLHGGWNLIRTRPGAGAKEHWLLIKERDDEAHPAKELDVLEAWPDSVKEIEKRKPAKRTKPAPRTSAADTRKAPASSPRRRPGPNLQASELPKAARKSPLPADVDAEPAAGRPSKGNTGRARAASVEPAATTSTARAKPRNTRDTARATAKAAVTTSGGTTARTARPAKSEAEVCGVRVSHPDRVIDRGTGLTKLDLVKYYDFMAERMLPHLHDRPMGLVRAPEGLHGGRFFQKHLEHLVIQEARLLPVELDPGHDALIVLETHKSLVSAAQMGVIELHGWNCQAKKFEQPDRFVLDLDPDESLPWAQVIEAAELTKGLLDELKIKSFVKTTGGKGLHVVVPLKPQFGWQEVKDFSEALAVHLAGTLPKRFSARMGKQNRVGRVFVDYLRNARGASSVAAYSARMRPRLPVSVPLAWEELVETKGSDQWTIANIGERLDSLGRDPWEDYEKSRQSIGEAIRVFTG
jgi:bifunctional non-homologous end joining protein LigD